MMLKLLYPLRYIRLYTFGSIVYNQHGEFVATQIWQYFIYGGCTVLKYTALIKALLTGFYYTVIGN